MGALAKIKKRLFGYRADLPTAVRLDLCTLCQLNCPGCFMRQWNYCNHGAGYVKLEQFKKFVDRHPFVKRISISAAGEVFLNPDIVPIMKYAFDKGITLDIGGGANFNTVSDEALEALVKYRVYHMSLAIDGACQESYVKYRIGGDFDQVLENIKMVNRFKEKYNSELPYMNWQYVILPTNESEAEIQRAKEMAAALGMSIGFARDHYGYVPRDLDMIKRETDLDYRSIQRYSLSKGRFIPCFQLFKCPQINWDGRFLGCCSSHLSPGSFGLNVFEKGLEKCLDSDIIKETKAMLMGGGICENSPCFKCQFYKTMQAENYFLTEREIEDLASKFI
ncbi:MAG: hypothetical protein FWD15_00945 [Alphaproteobacteria bacterium]|nr:hypothetical protein [Alphaproteobacteria bacterium]